ncbi:cytochrome c [Thiobacillus sp.]|uniref:c-type cytochrome n=1 Tax=Thiobacillus sp. TaxID=924 RepID=UPI00344944C4
MPPQSWSCHARRSATDPEKGAGQYDVMCTSCHLAPGMEDSELRPGLYPKPSNLSDGEVDPRETFWVIKHGLKMSAIPAWGMSHDDATIWSMVAFMRKLPDMTPAQYKEISRRRRRMMRGGRWTGRTPRSHTLADKCPDHLAASARSNCAFCWTNVP